MSDDITVGGERSPDGRRSTDLRSVRRESRLHSRLHVYNGHDELIVEAVAS
jgi:hypothetical protein